MNNEGLVADVDDPGDTVTRVEGGRRAGVILHCAVIIAVLDFLRTKHMDKLFLRHRIIKYDEGIHFLIADIPPIQANCFAFTLIMQTR